MARPIDEKIVAMKMDNSDFKQKATETTSIFGKLRDGLNKIPGVDLSKTTQQLSNIKTAANNVDLGNLSRAADAVTQRFSNLGVVATTALVNITNRAVNAGMAIANSLGPQQVRDGFSEYELKMRSIGTMLANTEWAGSNLDDVKKTLNDLNNYADKTIYNFGQMTDNVGRFTAAGVTLEDSAIAIKGLGNLAAISGSDVNQLNTAMYQMSQALASGKLNLMDWNSLVNAGMAGKKTQDALVKTARKMGKTVDLTNGFRDSIQDGWLTSKVFLATLKQFGKDKSMTEAATKVRTFTGMMDALKEGIGSGWATSWEIIFGDYEEATKFWTKISDTLNGIFQKSTDSRNKMLRAIFDDGGLNSVLESISNVGTPIVQVFKAIGAGFREAFPPVSVKSIRSMMDNFKEFTASLKLSASSVNNIKTIFAGLFSILSIGWKVIKEISSAFMGMLPGVKSLGAGILSLIATVFKIPIAFDKSTKSGDVLGAMGEALKSIFEGLGTVLSKVGSGFEYLGETIGQVWAILASGKVTDGPFGENSAMVSGLLKVREVFKQVFDYIGGISISSIGSGILDFFKSIGEGAAKIKDSIGGLDGLFEKVFGWMRDNQGWLLAGGGMAGLVAIGWKVFDFFKNLTKPLEGVGEILEGVNDALSAFTIGIHVKSLLTIAVAVGILAGSFMLLAKLDTDQITRGLYMIVGSLAAMVGALVILTKFDIGGGFGATLTILGMAAAILIMSKAVKSISSLNYGEITKGVVALVATLGTLTGAIVLMSKFGGAQLGASALQFLAIAASIKILVSVIKDVSKIKPGILTKGLLTLTAVFAQLTMFMVITKGSTFNASSGIGLLAMAVGIKMIASAIGSLGKLDTGTLMQGLLTIGSVFTAIGLLSKVTSNAGLLASGAGILLIAASINALMLPIAAFGKMKAETLAKGLITIASALVIFGLASKLMVGSIGAAVALGLMAGAMSLLIVPMAAFGAMSWGMIIKGVVGMALAMGSLGGMALLLAPAVIPLLAFSAAVGVLGLAVLVAGSGLSMFAKGLIMLAGLGAGAATVIIAFVGALVTGFATLLPSMTDLALKIMNAILGVFARMIPKIVTTIATLLLTLLNKIAEYIPQFATAGTNIIVGFLNGIENNAPLVIAALSSLVLTMTTTMADTIGQNGGPFIEAWTRLMGEVLLVVVKAGTEMVTALFGWIPGVKTAAGKIGKTAENYIKSNFGAKGAGSEKGKDFANGLSGKSGEAKSAGAKVGHAGKEGAKSANIKTVGNAKGAEFAKALADKAGTAKSSGTTIANAGKSGANSVDMHTAGSNFGMGFANGISSGSVMDKVMGAAQAIANAAKSRLEKFLDMHSPSREMRKDGGHFGEGFALGIADKVKRVGNAAKDMAYGAMDSVNKFIEGFSLPEDNNEIHIKAVIDYDPFDPTKFGPAPLSIAPNTRFTNSLAYTTDPNTYKQTQYNQFDDRSSIIKQQDEQIGLLKEQNAWLSRIASKDNNVYLDGKQMYQRNKKIQNDNINTRNLFKGVPSY